ncbi:DUF2867 domain-containing protein [Skermania sp. ID1734]|uniref:DUF2867 domain-containing protein n=1 Tax=Skermania sp. ID1734 TaxID=2597516 RepID=UPI0011815B31|nr:DUF2867 domain-containing protein [Skermania sp. ID1734]TSE00439.1 DUF2867 domain-containing protein [Skermania sp. ID1734]
MQSRARKVQTPQSHREVSGLNTVDYTVAFELPFAEFTPDSAEKWAREVWEGSPAAVRVFLLTGWRFVLWLRLGPLRNKHHVLGWRIESIEPKLIVLSASSWLMHARNIIEVDRERRRLVWSTLVQHRNPVSRVVWAMVVTIHKLTIPRLLDRAARAEQVR